MEALAWGPWPGVPGLRAQGGPDGQMDRRTDGWTDGQTDGWTKYPLYSTGHRPSGAAAQKAVNAKIKSAGVPILSLIQSTLQLAMQNCHENKSSHSDVSTF